MGTSSKGSEDGFQVIGATYNTGEGGGVLEYGSTSDRVGEGGGVPKSTSDSGGEVGESCERLSSWALSQRNISQ